MCDGSSGERATHATPNRIFSTPMILTDPTPRPPAVFPSAPRADDGGEVEGGDLVQAGGRGDTAVLLELVGGGQGLRQAAGTKKRQRPSCLTQSCDAACRICVGGHGCGRGCGRNCGRWCGVAVIMVVGVSVSVGGCKVAIRLNLEKRLTSLHLYSYLHTSRQ